jgi:hypothetical protein
MDGGGEKNLTSIHYGSICGRKEGSSKVLGWDRERSQSSSKEKGEGSFLRLSYINTYIKMPIHATFT